MFPISTPTHQALPSNVSGEPLSPSQPPSETAAVGVQKAHTFPYYASSSREAARLKIPGYVAGAGIKKHGETRWVLESIQHGRRVEASSTLARLLQHNNSEELKTWGKHVQHLISAMEELPVSSRKIVEELIGNALEKKLEDTFATLSALNDEMIGVRRLRACVLQLVTSYNAAEGERSLRHLDGKQTNIVDLIAKCDLTEARAALTQIAGDIDHEGTHSQRWLAATADVIARGLGAFAETSKEITSSLAAAIGAGQYDKAIDLVVEHAHSAAVVETGKQQELISAATVLIAYCKEHRPASFANRRLCIVRDCLAGDAEKATESLSLLLSNFPLDDTNEAWVNSVKGLLASARDRPPLLRGISDGDTIRRLEAGESLEDDAALNRFFVRVDADMASYAACAENLKAAIKPFVRLEGPVSLRESDKLAVARLLANEFDDANATRVLTEILASRDFDEASKNWIRDCANFIATYTPAPLHLSEVAQQLNALVREGKAAEAESFLNDLMCRPDFQAKADNETALWTTWAFQSIYFIAVPLLLDRINDELENSDADRAVHLLTSLVQYQNDQQNDLQLSSDVHAIIERINKQSAIDGFNDWQAPVAVRPSAEPEENDDLEQGLFLSGDGRTIVKTKKNRDIAVLLDRVQVDHKNRTIKSEAGDYLAHYSSSKGNRLHADDNWLSRLPPVLNVKRTEMLRQQLSAAMGESNNGPRKSQNTYEENMKMLQRVKAQARAFSKAKRLDPKRIGATLMDHVDIGEIVDAGLSVMSGSFGYHRETPGKLLGKYGRAAKAAFTPNQIDLNKEYEKRLMLLRDEVKYELKKLHPVNQRFCTDLQDLIADKIRKLKREVAPDDWALQELDGMFEWHQRVLSINHYYPIQLKIDHDEKERLLASLPNGPWDSELSVPERSDSLPADFSSNKGEGASKKPVVQDGVSPVPAGVVGPSKTRNTAADQLRFALDHYEKAHSSEPYDPTQKNFLFHGNGGIGKSFDSRRVGLRVYNAGKLTKIIPPEYNSFGGLVKKTNKAASDDLPYYRPNTSPWTNTPEDQVGALVAYIMQGYEIFIFDESEKILAPQRFSPGGTDTSDRVKFLLDKDTKEVDVEIGGLTFVVPWHKKMSFFNTNKNFSSLGFSREDLRAFMRRFDAKILYEEASFEALKSAFEKGVAMALALESDQAKASRIRTYLETWKIDEYIIGAGRAIQSDLASPDTVRGITSVVIHAILKTLKDIDPDSVEQNIKLDELYRIIDDHWTSTHKKYSKEATEMAAMPPPPQPAPQLGPPAPLPPVSFRQRFDNPTRIKVSSAVCNETLRRYNEELTREQARVVTELFIESNCINEIVKRFNKVYVRNNAYLRWSFIDRDVLRQAVEAAHTYFLKNYGKSDFASKNVFDEIRGVFSQAKRLTDDSALRRTTCFIAFNACNASLGNEDAAEVSNFFLEYQCINVIMSHFVNYRFSTERTLRGAVEKAHATYMDNRERDDFRPQMVIDAIINFFEEAARENNREILPDALQVTHHPFDNELSSSDMSDSDDLPGRKVRKRRFTHSLPVSAQSESSQSQRDSGKSPASSEQSGQNLTLNLQVNVPPQSKTTASFRSKR